MPYYRSVGEVPLKRHTQFRRPDGGLYAEELMGQEGFSSDSSLLYHRHLPTAIVACETIRESSGLALSSRNARLSTDQREHAAGFYAALTMEPTADQAVKEVVFIPQNVFLGVPRDMEDIVAAVRKVEAHQRDHRARQRPHKAA